MKKLLTDIKNKTLSYVHRSNPFDYRDKLYEIRQAFRIENLIENGVAFSYENYGEGYMLEEDVDRILKDLEGYGVDDPELIKSRAPSIEVADNEKLAPIIFNDKEDYIRYKKKQRGDELQQTSPNETNKERYFLLPEFKNKVIFRIHNDADEYEEDTGPLINYVKDKLLARTMVSEGKEFMFEETGIKLVLSESSVDEFLADFKNQGVKNTSIIKSKINEFEPEGDALTPIVFDDFNQFVSYKKSQQSNTSINKYLKKRQKEEKAAQKEAKQSNNVKQIVNNINDESVFMAIDFECSYDNNHIPLEVGVCSFGAKDKTQSISGEHWIFQENEQLLKEQPKKFKKQNHFEHGETSVVSYDEIAQKLQQKVDEVDFIVCHAAQLEKSMMRKLGVDFSQKSIIDSQLMHKVVNGDKQVSSIEKIARIYEEDEKKLHNAGNDAVFTGRYFLSMVQNQKPELKITEGNGPENELPAKRMRFK